MKRYAIETVCDFWIDEIGIDASLTCAKESPDLLYELCLRKQVEQAKQYGQVDDSHKERRFKIVPRNKRLTEKLTQEQTKFLTSINLDTFQTLIKQSLIGEKSFMDLVNDLIEFQVKSQLQIPT